MATYTHNVTAVPSGIAWYNVNIDGDNPATATATLLVLPNSDGTFTLIHGNGFTYDGVTGEPTGGTITSIDRANNAAGTTIYETVTGLNHSLVTLVNSPDDGNRSAFAFLFNAADTFNGFAGDDLFVGGPLGDAFTGGTGTDTVSYDNALAAVRADLFTPATNTGDAAGDTYTSIENLIGSDFNDTLIGTASVNVLTGGLGNDSFVGGGGNDTLNGGAGSDTAIQTSSTAAGITAILSTTSTVTGDAAIGTDTLISVEGVRGTSFVDTFTATTTFNGSNGTGVDFEGMGGNDVITGNGTTRVSYTQALAGVTVNLLAGTAQSTAGGDAAGVGVDSFAGVIGPDNINAVNAVRGSNFADTITAAGARGFFQFIGLGGNDTFIGTTEAINNFDVNLARYDIFSGNLINNGVDVALDATSTVTDKAGGTAAGTDTLINIERIRGTGLADTFTANAGFSGQYGTLNYFEGMGGNDTITGNGHTVVQFSNALAAVTVNLQTGTAQSTAGGDAAGIGTDTITGGVNNVLGSDFNDTLTGSNGAQAENFNGDAGNDTINGGGGVLDRVSYRGDASEVTVNLTTGTFLDGFGGTDTVTNVEGVVGSEFNDSITGDGNANRLQGQNGDDTLLGMGGDDFLVGDDGVDLYAGAFGGVQTAFDSGNDTLDGGTGADQMWGGKGNDAYFVDNVADVVTENASEGNDLINTSVNYTLSANAEALVLVEGAGPIAGLGNSTDNFIGGNSDNNALDGGAGSDFMVGGAGNDTYTIDSAGDAVSENLNEGNDVVHATIDYTIGANIESLILDGTTINGAGNATDNAVIGNSADNILDGRAGSDFMVGSTGGDIYFVDNAGDAIVENLNEGNDIVHATIDYTIGANIESLILDGTTVNGAGNGTDNAIIGNASNNIIDGRAGSDFMQGGDGDDIYFVDNAGDAIVENLNEGNDIVHATIDYTIGANIESLILDGSSNIAGAGNSTNNAIVGNSGNNVIDGRGGQDFLTGNDGNDIFQFQAGEASGDLVADFNGNGAGAGDSFQFLGFGTAALGATLTQIGATNQWQITSGLDAHTEIITLQNSASVHASDFIFI